MPRLFRLLLSLLIVAIIVVAPLVYKSTRDTRFRNFHVVSEGKLYRSGQMSLNGLKRIIHDYRIKTVVTLKAVVGPAPVGTATRNVANSTSSASLPFSANVVSILQGTAAFPNAGDAVVYAWNPVASDNAPPWGMFRHGMDRLGLFPGAGSCNGSCSTDMSFCTSATFNLTNGWQMTWAP